MIRPMGSRLEELVGRAPSGDYQPFHDLVNALRQDVAVESLVNMVETGDEVLRRAVIQAARGRTEPALLVALAGLVSDSSEWVRRSLAEALEDVPDWPLHSTVERLL